ncbi:Maturation and nuclear export of 40S ribosomal subunits interacting protein, partial [Dimargaris verticillata]
SSDGDAVSRIRQLEDQVFESKKHLNNVVDILEFAKSDDPKTVYSSIHALLRIYTPFIKDGTTREKAAQDEQAEVAPAKAKVDQWVRKKYSQFHATLNSLLRHDNTTLQVAAARIFMQLIEKESMASSELSGSYRFAHGTYRRVLRTVLSTPQLSDELCHLLVNSYLNTYDDLRYYFFEIAT